MSVSYVILQKYGMALYDVVTAMWLETENKIPGGREG
jgi:hypothetical protein